MTPSARSAIVTLLMLTLAHAGGVGSQGPPAAAPFACGADQSLPTPIPLTVANVILAGDGRLFSPCPQRGADGSISTAAHPAAHREMREAALLAQAASAAMPELRWRAAQAYGRIANPDFVGATGAGALPRLLDDADRVVRREAANAIGTALSGSVGDLNAAFAARATPAHVLAGRRALETRLAREQDNDVAAAILETLGRLNYADDAARAEIEKTLAAQLSAAAPRIVGAAKGLEALLRRRPMRAIDPATRAALRRVAIDAASPERARRLAFLSLQTARDDDAETLITGAADADWQVRRLVALRLDFARPEHAPAIARALADPDFQVRYDILMPLSRQVMRDRACAPLAKFIDDPAPIVAMRAIDLIPASCAEPAAIVAALTKLADRLTDAAARETWHVPARALAALARIAPDEARARIEPAAAHPAWQVRATAATAAGLIGVEPPLLRLSDDREPNVRNATLDALNRIKSPPLIAAAIKALASDDYQLIRTAAAVLRGAPEPARGAVTEALMQTMRRLTDTGRDTSRDPRMAIIERLKELLPASGVAALAPFAIDVDPKIREAAAAGATVASPRQRYPAQPPASLISALPTTAIITMAGGGVIKMQLQSSQAPVTVAKFVELVRAGHYNGLTFHRIVPNFVVQGGSPGANEYMGAARYWRDEIGLESNLRGTVGLSTRGRDTGDGQFYVNLVDVPRLDHDYTVFARITSGMDIVDRMLEGARIQTIVVGSGLEF